MRQRLARHPRWTFQFTPTSTSWLNAVEGPFTILTTRRLKRGVSRSVAEPQEAINRFLVDHNAQTKPSHWVTDPDKIIAAVRRGHQALDSIHWLHLEEAAEVTAPANTIARNRHDTHILCLNLIL